MNRATTLLRHIHPSCSKSLGVAQTKCQNEPDWSVSEGEAFSERLFRLDNRVAVVTGAARGIGREIARCFASVGASVLMVDVLEEDLTRSAKDISAETGANIISCTADTTDLDQVEKAVELVVSSFGGIDILVTAAGIAPENREDIHIEEFKHVMEVNLNGALYFVDKSLPHLKKSTAGRIITVTSSIAIQSAPNMLGYSVSKGGIIHLTKALASKLAKHNITVNSLMPGWTDTKMAYDVAGGDFTKAKKDSPLRRIGTPRDLAGMAVYLASNLASFVTGATMRVNGGFRV